MTQTLGDADSLHGPSDQPAAPRQQPQQQQQ
jgi:hypothetical protein